MTGAASAPRQRASGGERRRPPAWLEPQLATLTRDRFSDPEWIFEHKYDGERCLAYRDGGQVRLLTRNKKQANDAYPELVEALAAQRADDFIVDGEVVSFEGSKTSFARLQQRIHVRQPSQDLRVQVPVYFYLFDLLYVDGEDVRTSPLLERKQLLRTLLSFHDPLRFTVHRDTDGEAYFNEACRDGWEGLVAKRADAPYRPGRSPDWLKFKCENAQELVIGGYTDPQGSRSGFGALLLGYYDEEGRLTYAGKVGTGFDDETLRSLHDEMAGIQREHPPFERGSLPRSQVHWVEPRLVGQIGFTEWTAAGQLRHPRFQGLRRDKAPIDVVREEA